MTTERARAPVNTYHCPVHDGQIHGGEAEELRSGLETMLDTGTVTARAVRRLLDRVDARDSLAHGEAQARRRKPRRTP